MTGSRWPAEWEPQARLLTAWPDHEAEWPAIEPARESIASLCRAIGDSQPVTLYVAHSQPEKVAEQVGEAVSIATLGYGDIWMRDTAPVFHIEHGALVATAFRWTGWGGSFVLPGDETVAAAIADTYATRLHRSSIALEGGGLETDGRGTVITTLDCALHDGRNPDADPGEIEADLFARLGVEKTIWLERGLANDHTDGHVDNLARFVGPALVACAEPTPGDPNHDVHREVHDVLAASEDASATSLDVVLLPSPGAVTDRDGELLAASYLNFVITNHVVIVPTFDRDSDERALAALDSVFPDRQIVGVAATPLLYGGGAFHCVTAHIPELADSPAP